jgi:hypothetical protein
MSQSLVRERANDAARDGGDDVSLFIGILPGSDRRQVVLFPDGVVLADICDHRIETGSSVGPDQGLIAASLLIGMLRDNGWYIEELTSAAAVWLKPPPRHARADVGDPGGEIADARP